MKKLLIVLLVLFALLLLYILGLIFIAPKMQYYPTSGQWYCEELQMTLCFDHGMNQADANHTCSYVTIDGQKIPCSVHYMESKVNFRVAYYDSVSDTYFDHTCSNEIGESTEYDHTYSGYHVFYYGIAKSINKTKFVTKDRDTGETYIFYRI